jgi:hypothetical protein
MEDRYPMLGRGGVPLPPSTAYRLPWRQCSNV